MIIKIKTEHDYVKHRQRQANLRESKQIFLKFLSSFRLPLLFLQTETTKYRLHTFSWALNEPHYKPGKMHK